ncbi:MAG: LPS export ABC transporter periplasmic protein LptC [Bacteroidales bacterium]
MKHFSSQPFFSYCFLIAFLLLLAGCGNDIETVNAITHNYSGPVMSAKNIEVVFSDSGKIQAKVYSILLNRYSIPEPSMEFPCGFKVNIFDTALRTETTIMANYGKRKEYTRIMEAKGNVIVRNEVKKQQLNTEQLTWDENRRMIFTSEPVKITTLDKIVFGKGLRSNESFSDYTILHVYGQMMVKKDSI